jgi:hypothetical protein
VVGEATGGERRGASAAEAPRSLRVATAEDARPRRGSPDAPAGAGGGGRGAAAVRPAGRVSGGCPVRGAKDYYPASCGSES